jgi:hypothetical protein
VSPAQRNASLRRQFDQRRCDWRRWPIECLLLSAPNSRTRPQETFEQFENGRSVLELRATRTHVYADPMASGNTQAGAGAAPDTPPAKDSLAENPLATFRTQTKEASVQILETADSGCFDQPQGVSATQA